jgi:nitrate/TMAO reductase-like tetraheme cytochrome c subunit
MYRNWMSVVGLFVVLGSALAFVLLFVLDALQGSANPYVGVLTYLVAPTFTALGLLLIAAGALARRRQLARYGEAPSRLVIDLTRRADRRILSGVVAAGLVFFLVTAVGSYGTYQFTESVTFCGQICHSVMKPEWTTYLHSPHARVACAECHIGPGASWWVRSKLSGLRQVYAVLANSHPRPIPTPIENLRPARATCEECHWPQKFSGDLVRSYRHHLSDDANSPHDIRLLLKVGGGDPARGPVAGIHWHTSAQVEYFARDERRQEIPWVRVTQPSGRVTVFRAPQLEGDPDPRAVRTMDCLDCHNRPAHIFEPPHDAVDRALRAGRIDASLPAIRRSVSEALAGDYASEAQALARIEAELASRYPGDARVQSAIAAAQQIYRDNFFPEMKASWKDYPENIGHKVWPGCTRCHDDQHVSEDGARVIGFADCESCHSILSQGDGASDAPLRQAGLAFDHPVLPYDPTMKCHTCHTGGP